MLEPSVPSAKSFTWPNHSRSLPFVSSMPRVFAFSTSSGGSVWWTRILSFPSASSAASASHSASVSQVWTPVTPYRRASAWARKPAAFRSSSVGGGITFSMILRYSRHRPIGRPFASRSIRAPGASTASFVIPASFMAMALIQTVWPQHRTSITG